jgi:LysM repeat protein
MPYAYETVTVSSMTSLTVLAHCAGTDAGTLKALNPELLRGSTPPGTYQLRVPPGKAMDCLRHLAGMPAGKRLDFKGYTVQKGDTVAKVAKRFKLSSEDLLAANDITAKQFKPGKRLLVPPPPAVAVEARDLASAGKGKALGDRPLPSLPNLPRDLSDAQQSAVVPDIQPSVPLVVTPTRPDAGSLTPARPIEVPVPGVQAEPSSLLVIRARPGDTLAKLARAHQVSLGELLRLNPGATKALHPGDEVRLPGGAPVAPASTSTPSVHRVQKGESLALIARKYGVDPKDLKTWNRLKSDRIQTGQRLRLNAP